MKRTTIKCPREECFACVSGKCSILTDVENKGEGCSFFQTKKDQPFLAYRYEKEKMDV